MSRDNSATIPWMRARKLDGRAGPGSEILQVGLSRLPNRLWRWANEVQEKEWWEEDFKDGWAGHEFGRRWEKGCSRCWTLTVWENPPRLFQVGAEVVEVAHRNQGSCGMQRLGKDFKSNIGPTHQRQVSPVRLLGSYRAGPVVTVNKDVSCSLCHSFFRSLGMSELTQWQA